MSLLQGKCTRLAGGQHHEVGVDADLLGPHAQHGRAGAGLQCLQVGREAAVPGIAQAAGQTAADGGLAGPAQAQQGAQAAPGGQEGDRGGAEQGQGGGEPREQAGNDSGGQAQEQEGGEPAQPAQGGEDLTRSLDQAIAAMSKGEGQLPPAKRKILRQHRKFVQQTVASLDRELGDLFGDKR